MATSHFLFDGVRQDGHNVHVSPMLEIADLSLVVDTADQPTTLIHEASARFPEGHFCAILGPSGCGKSTLIKLIAGLVLPTDGKLRWRGRDVSEDHDLEPHEIGYVPQFSITHEYLTVLETVENAVRLRVAGITRAEFYARVQHLLADTGLQEIAMRQVAVLSGGQRRRLALAIELASRPALLLCDEVTTGLDPKAEDEIVHLLKTLSQEDKRIILSVTHSLRHAELYDSILVIHAGHVIFHGAPDFLYHYFSLGKLHDLFPRLAGRKPDEWHRSWRKHRGAYYAAQVDAYQPVGRVEEDAGQTVGYDDLPLIESKVARKKGKGDTAAIVRPRVRAATPGFTRQFLVLLSRRWTLFLRDRSQCLLQVALVFGFPCLVVIFGWGGLPHLHQMTAGYDASVIEQVLDQAKYSSSAAKTGGLASGIVMFQVILLALMGANNASREIAGERLLFEKEKFAGLRTSAWLASKIAYLAVLVMVQSAWMAYFVGTICRLPGDLFSAAGILALLNGAVTAACLAISSHARSPEQASLLGIYFVGFQLPLSGAVLAMPDALATITRPFIAAYWGWAGSIQVMRDSGLYEAVRAITDTPLLAMAMCVWVLVCHMVIGIWIAYIGARRSQWE